MAGKPQFGGGPDSLKFGPQFRGLGGSAPGDDSALPWWSKRLPKELEGLSSEQIRALCALMVHRSPQGAGLLLMGLQEAFLERGPELAERTGWPESLNTLANHADHFGSALAMAAILNG